MAYVSPELKKSLVPGIKAVLKKYGVKGTVSVLHHSTLRVRLTAGAVPFPDDMLEHGTVNRYGLSRNFDGIAREFLTELDEAINVGNFDRSDIMTDFFCVGYYTAIRVGDWGKPYRLI